MGQTGSTWREWEVQANGRQVQRPLQGVGAGQQGVEDPGGREGGCRLQGPPEASPGQRGPQGPVQSRHRRPRTASVVSVASAPVAGKPGGPV